MKCNATAASWFATFLENAWVSRVNRPRRAFACRLGAVAPNRRVIDGTGGLFGGRLPAALGVALALVLVTFNPTRWSYASWLLEDWPGGNLPIKALAGVVLLILWVIFLRATWRSIGALGLVLAALFFGAVLWVLVDYDLLDPRQPHLMTWITLAVVATILATGMSWSHVRRRLSGQVDVDDVDEE